MNHTPYGLFGKRTRRSLRAPYYSIAAHGYFAMENNSQYSTCDERRMIQSPEMEEHRPIGLLLDEISDTQLVEAVNDIENAMDLEANADDLIRTLCFFNAELAQIDVERLRKQASPTYGFKRKSSVPEKHASKTIRIDGDALSATVDLFAVNVTSNAAGASAGGTSPSATMELSDVDVASIAAVSSAGGAAPPSHANAADASTPSHSNAAGAAAGTAANAAGSAADTAAESIIAGTSGVGGRRRCCMYFVPYFLKQHSRCWTSELCCAYR